MITLNSLVKVSISGIDMVNKLGIDQIDAFKIQGKYGVVVRVIDKNVVEVRFGELDNGFNYRFEKKYLTME